MTLFKGVIAGAIIIAVTETGPKYPRIGGLLLTLPLVSVLAFIMAWTKQGDLPTTSALAKETLILVPLGLLVFVVNGIRAGLIRSACQAPPRAGKRWQ